MVTITIGCEMAECMDWEKLLCSGRLGVEPSAPKRNSDFRSEFQRDYDRIVFSDSFRRLQGKTQVHPLPENEHVHNRLTHSLEVSCVGRSLGEAVGARLHKAGLLPESVDFHEIGALVQAACIMHDIGNPPFGHRGGEPAIREWYEEALASGKLVGLNEKQKADLLNFEGNAQGFRIAAQLELNRFKYGMRLTYATLATFCKYPWGVDETYKDKESQKFAVFQADMPLFRKVAEKVGLLSRGTDKWCRHPLTYLVEASDDICYLLMDFEDGIELGLVKLQEFEDAMLPILAQSDVADYASGHFYSYKEKLSFLRGKIMDRIVAAVIEAFFANYDAIMSGSFLGKDLSSVCSPDVRKCLEFTKYEIGFKKLYGNERRVGIDNIAMKRIKTIRDECSRDIFGNGHLPQETKGKWGQVLQKVMGERVTFTGASTYESLMLMNDFISGLTDRRVGLLAEELGNIVV